MFKLSLANYFAGNTGGTTIQTNFNYTCPRTICVKNPRILFSWFGEEDLESFNPVEIPI